MKNNTTDSFTPDSFPGKLWKLVNNPHITSISWDPSGEGVLIYEKLFEDEVLMSHSRLMRNYFKSSSFISFIRQLNLYGFKKVKTREQFSKDQPRHFHNPNFKRDKPELLLKIKRLTVSNKAKIAAGIEVPSLFSRCVHHGLLNSCQENSSAMIKGSEIVQHQNGPQQYNRMTSSSHNFVMSHSQPTSQAMYVNPVVPLIGFHLFPAGAHSSSLVQHAIIPHDSQDRFYSPGCQSNPLKAQTLTSNPLPTMKNNKTDFFTSDSFPGKLWHLVNDPHITSIKWDLSGEGVLIYEKPFEDEVLMSHSRNYFKSSSFTSFIRQMNLYGFKKVKEHGQFSMDQPYHLHNPNFKRDKPELLLKLKRLTVSNKAKIAAGIEVPSLFSRCVHHGVLNSCQEKSASMITGHECNPGIMDSTVPIPEQPSPSKCDYDPDYSFSYIQPDIPDRNTGSDPEKIDLEMNRIFKLVEELENVDDARGVTEVTSHLENNLE